MSDELEARVEQLEQDLEFLETSLFDLEDVVTGEYSVANVRSALNGYNSIVECLVDLLTENIDPHDLATAVETGDLPIQVKAAQRHAGQYGEAAARKAGEVNKWRALLIWEAFDDRAVNDYNQYKLTSRQVKQILDQHDQPTDRNTVRRAMEFTARLTNPDGDQQDAGHPDNLVKIDRGGEVLTLFADADEWDAFFEDQAEAIREDARSEMEQLTGAMTSD